MFGWRMPLGLEAAVVAMRAYVIPAGNTALDGLRRVDRPDSQPRAGQVLVRVRAASLNRRDHAVITGTNFGRPVPRDTIPLSDSAGEVAAVGAGVTRFEPGDRVVATYLQTPPDGAPFGDPSSLGFPLDGMLADQVVLYENGLLPIPDGLSFEEAACLPCAGVTAWNALMVSGRAVAPGDTVLVLGTGGVSMFALQFALAAGARVIVTSSSDEKIERVKALGASDGVNYTRLPEWHKEVLRITGGRGVDCVVEVGGVGTLERSFDSLAAGGKVGLIGVLTGRQAAINPYGLMWKEGTLHGIRVGDRRMFEQMNRAIELKRIRPVIDTVFPFDDVIGAFQHQASAPFIGKLVVRIG
jgi:NADPH:quinone reductase-like Zn-dependent oxidoreductase